MSATLRWGIILQVMALFWGLREHVACGQPCTESEWLKLVPFDPQESHGYSIGLALSGPWCAIGADGTDLSIFFANSGAVYMYLRLDGDALSFRQRLTASDTVGGEFLGHDLAMNSSHIVAGANVDSTPCGGNECYAGSAYVFRLNQAGTPDNPLDDTWVEQAKLTAPDPIPDEFLGANVAIHGDWIVAGAPMRGCFPGSGSGSAYIYHRRDNGTPSDPADDTWPFHARLTSPGVAQNPDDHFGRDVAIWNDWVAVSATSLCGFSSSDDPGTVYVFRRDEAGTPGDVDDDVWNLESTLHPIWGDGAEQFGDSVDMEGDVLAVGMPGDSTFGPLSGSVYVYRLDDGGTLGDPSDDEWGLETILFTPLVGPFAELGDDVAISGDRIIAGAWEHIEDIFTEGAGFVFRYAGGVWHDEQRLLGSDIVDGGELGQYVAIDGEWILLSQDDDDEAELNAGAAYLYRVEDDCNGDCTTDADELAAGATDCNANELPVECEPDCNNNGVADECDIATGASGDCNLNAVPDECDRDCNGDGLPDDCATVCTDHCECNDFTACTLDYCVDGACVHTDCLYGDVTGSGVVNVFDVFGILNQIASADGQSTLHLYDIKPCHGDDAVNVFDALAVLDAIAGTDPCCSGP